MSIDAGIYNQLNIPDPMAGANAIGLYQQGKQNQIDQKNKLAALAQQQEMQGYQLNAARRNEAAIPQQQADASRNREADYMRGVAGEIAQNPQSATDILTKHKTLAAQTGIDPNHFDWLAKDLLGSEGATSSQMASPDEVAKKAFMHSLTQEQINKLQFDQMTLKPTFNADAGGYVYPPNAQNPNGRVVTPQGFTPKVVETPADKRKAEQDNKIEIAKLVAGLRPPNQDNTLVSVIGPDGVTPVLVPRSQAAGMRPAVSVGAGADKPLNDTQSKALLFGSRMKAANDIFDKLEKLGTTTSTIGSNLPFLGTAINAMSSSDKQELNQGKRDFINAVLRRESGAAIASSEFDNGEKQYFPQIGDSVSVIQQKKANRDLAMRGVLAEVPEKHRNELFQNNKNLPSSNAKGWILHTDANGNKAYVSKDGSQYEEVK